jgi:hypothetical protein
MPAGPASRTIAATADAVVVCLLAPLDRARADLLRLCGAALAPALRDRDLRVALLGTTAVVTALLLTLCAPVALLALGPLVLGVPHLVGDVRHLVVRRGLHRRPLVLLLLFAPLVVTWFERRLALGLLATVAVALVARTAWTRRLAAAAPLAAAVALAVHHGPVADIVMAHLHNFIAVLLWWRWRPGRRFAWAPLLAFVAGAALLLAGVAEGWMLRRGLLEATIGGATLLDVAGFLAPLSDPSWCLRLMLLFAFAQSVHYAVWVRLVPEDDRPRAGVRSFSASYRAAAADIGRPLVWGAALLGLALLAWGVFDPNAARDNYLRVAFFHGPLEIAAATLFALERRSPASASC